MEFEKNIYNYLWDPAATVETLGRLVVAAAAIVVVQKGLLVVVALFLSAK